MHMGVGHGSYRMGHGAHILHRIPSILGPNNSAHGPDLFEGPQALHRYVQIHDLPCFELEFHPDPHPIHPDPRS